MKTFDQCLKEYVDAMNKQQDVCEIAFQKWLSGYMEINGQYSPPGIKEAFIAGRNSK